MRDTTTSMPVEGGFVGIPEETVEATQPLDRMQLDQQLSSVDSLSQVSCNQGQGSAATKGKVVELQQIDYNLDFVVLI
ncbi:hypothetical protein HAN_3g430 (nucleomorph) [Hemiselmis andersenii]|uniref:Uncharacterized protein n=1 Tax=Hemiselmis andersenii TaxID=464988 RepID=A9BL52_HEMAN|nr:hypothetical protein HAN_3g430 [Hemiselmis andersenii]ABW98235.1 hypothetical protein HAN_3g430 [Hemiselmis andersenii]